MKKVFRVYCEFLIKAKDEREIKSYLQEEPDFVEQHIIIEEDTPGGLIPRLKYEAETEKEIYQEL